MRGPLRALRLATLALLALSMGPAAVLAGFDDQSATRLPALVNDSYSIAVGDVDDNDTPDIVVANGGQPTLLLNDGAGSYTDGTAQLPVLDADIVAAALAKVDDDEHLDMVLANASGPDFVLINDGAGNFSDESAARIPQGHHTSTDVAVLDLDQDGAAEIVFAIRGDANRILTNDGTGVFTQASLPSAGADAELTTAVAAGDANGDGSPDLFFANEFGQNRLFSNSGLGVFTDVSAAALPAGADESLGAGLGDVDDDGDLDLVVANGSASAALLLNDAGVFGAAGPGDLPIVSDYVIGVSLGDVDFDGSLDVVLVSAGQDSVLLNDGTGLFSDETAAQLPADDSRAFGGRLTDADADFDLDLFLARPQAGDRLLINQIDAPRIRLSVSPDFIIVGDPVEISVEVADEDGLVSTELEVNGSPVALVAGVGTYVPTVEGLHTATVTAEDNNGDIGTRSATFDVDPPDLAPPVISLSIDAPAPLLLGQAVTITATAADAENSVAFLEVTVNGAPLLLDSSGVGVYVTDAFGTHPVVATAEDLAGNPAVENGSFDVLADVDAPIVTVGATPDPVDLANPVAISVSATDNVAVSSLGLTVSGPGVTGDQDLPLDGSGNASFTPYLPGTYTLTGTATDPSGNPGAQSIFFGAVGDPDVTDPEVSVTVVPVTVAVGNDVTVTVVATDDILVASLTLEINGTPVALDGAGTATFTTPVVGGYTAEATATDPTGNSATASQAFTAVDPASDTEAPTVDITAPTDSQELTDSFDVVGTADDLTLVEYTLDYAPIGTSNYTVITTGVAPVINDVLGTIEPSLMPNGFYTLRLRAQDVNGLVAIVQTAIQVSGETKVGAFSISFTDLSIPVAGIPITITRTYDSRDVSTGDFGAGWKLDLSSATLEENRAAGADWFVSIDNSGFFPVYNLVESAEHRVVVTIGDETHEFGIGVSPSSSVLTPIQFVDSVFFPALPGTTSSLYGFGSPDFLSSAGGGPTQILDSDFSLYDPNSYLLTLEDGTELYFTGTGRRADLQSITDPNGNQISIGAGGIIHSAGLSIPFTRDGQGRITRITDPKGNTLDYSYDPQGDLIAFSNRESQTSSFAYNSTHGLLEIRDPTGNVGVRQEYDDDGRLVAVVDALGNRTEFSRDLDLNREVITDRLGGVTIVTYDAAGNVISEQGPDGGITTFAYDADGNVILTTLPDGSVLASTFDAAGNELTSTDALGNVTTRTFDAGGRELTTTDPLGNVTSRTFDANGNVTQIVGPQGNTTTAAYDDQGNVLTSTDPNGNVSSYIYDARGNQTTATDALGQVTTFAYDVNGNIATRVDDAGVTTAYAYDANDQLTQADVDGVVRNFQYDVNGRTAGVTDANGQETRFEYDAQGNRTALVGPDGATERWAYDAAGNLVGETDSLGNTTSHAYDASGNLVSTTHPDGSVETFEYDATDRMTRHTDALGHATNHGYDAAGRRISTTDALGNVTLFEYDARGNQTAMTDALGRRTEYEWEVRTPDPASDRLVRTTFSDGSVSQAAYDAAGNQTSATDALGHVWTYVYDALSRLVSVTDPLGNTTQYEYDLDSNRTAEIDALGNRTEFTYDPSGGLATTTHPLGQVKGATYDAAGRLATSTNENGDTLLYTYDVGGRLTELELSDTSTEITTWTLDDLIDSVTDARGVTQYAYDGPTRRPTRITEPDGRYVRYVYDAVGNRTVTAHAQNAGGTEQVTQYTYDALGRMIQVEAPDSGTTTYTYDAVGNLLETTLPTGAKTESTYDLLDRPLTVLHRAPGGAVLESFTYVLDALGNRTRETRVDATRVDYTYDAVSRVLSESHYDAGAALVDDATHTYDAVGNRTARGGSLGAATYTYDANNQLASGDGATYTYDAAGNLATATTAGNVTIYDWDDRGRLTSFVPPAAAGTTYTYDSFGVRQGASGPGGTIDYLVDRSNATGQSQVLRETDGSGTVLHSNVYGLDLLSRTNADTEFFHYDGLGSTRLLTDAAGAVTDTYRFDAYGEELARTGSSDNPYLFAGEHRDPDSGLYDLRARHYDPTTGRFVSRDPTTGDYRRPTTLHDYVYANGNPVNIIDPSGRFGIIQWIRAKLLGLFGGDVTQAEVGALEGSSARPLIADISVRYAKLITLVALADLYGSSSKYTTYFGDPSGGRLATVRTNFAKIVAAEYSYIEFNFTGDDVYAYVYSGGPLEIWLGYLYFNADMLGIDSQAGTIVHELSHEVAGTADHTYGIANSKNNAATAPNIAISNADNYEHFTEDGW